MIGNATKKLLCFVCRYDLLPCVRLPFRGRSEQHEIHSPTKSFSKDFFYIYTRFLHSFSLFFNHLLVILDTIRVGLEDDKAFQHGRHRYEFIVR